MTKQVFVRPLLPLASCFLLLSNPPLTAETKKPDEKHNDASEKLSYDQDDLAADVQEMIDVETNEKVITLFEKIEDLMGEVTDELEDSNTSGKTIAAETEIIEKIYQAAKEKST